MCARVWVCARTLGTVASGVFETCVNQSRKGSFSGLNGCTPASDQNSVGILPEDRHKHSRHTIANMTDSECWDYGRPTYFPTHPQSNRSRWTKRSGCRTSGVVRGIAQEETQGNNNSGTRLYTMTKGITTSSMRGRTMAMTASAQAHRNEQEQGTQHYAVMAHCIPRPGQPQHRERCRCCCR